jgi:hypothetical protein
MNYFEYHDKPVTHRDVIEWTPPAVNFEFHSGVCVERSIEQEQCDERTQEMRS